VDSAELRPEEPFCVEHLKERKEGRKDEPSACVVIVGHRLERRKRRRRRRRKKVRRTGDEALWYSERLRRVCEL